MKSNNHEPRDSGLERRQGDEEERHENGSSEEDDDVLQVRFQHRFPFGVTTIHEGGGNLDVVFHGDDIGRGRVVGYGGVVVASEGPGC